MVRSCHHVLLQGGVQEQEDVRGGSSLLCPHAVWGEASGETQCQGQVGLSFSVKIIDLMQLMKFGQKILGKGLFGFLMKQTFYGHFVAGADQDGIKPNIDRMHSFGVKSILDYSVEVDESEQKKEEKKVFKTKKVIFYIP